MAVARKPGIEDLIADKEALRKLLEEQDARIGFVPDPTVTPEQVRAMLLADGIRPEDNAFSRELIRMRGENSVPAVPFWERGISLASTTKGEKRWPRMLNGERKFTLSIKR
jgi:hypothetical protein